MVRPPTLDGRTFNELIGDDPRKVSFNSGKEAMMYAKEKSINA